MNNQDDQRGHSEKQSNRNIFGFKFKNSDRRNSLIISRVSNKSTDKSKKENEINLSHPIAIALISAVLGGFVNSGFAMVRERQTAQTESRKEIAAIVSKHSGLEEEIAFNKIASEAQTRAWVEEQFKVCGSPVSPKQLDRELESYCFEGNLDLEPEKLQALRDKSWELLKQDTGLFNQSKNIVDQLDSIDDKKIISSGFREKVADIYYIHGNLLTDSRLFSKAFGHYKKFNNFAEDDSYLKGLIDVAIAKLQAKKGNVDLAKEHYNQGMLLVKNTSDNKDVQDSLTIHSSLNLLRFMEKEAAIEVETGVKPSYCSFANYVSYKAKEDIRDILSSTPKHRIEKSSAKSDLLELEEFNKYLDFLCGDAVNYYTQVRNSDF